MVTTSYSQADIDAIAKAIREAPTPKASLSEFCSLWAQVKPVLETLQPIVGVIPVVGTIISAALATLLTVGNAAYAALCGGK